MPYKAKQKQYKTQKYAISKITDSIDSPTENDFYIHKHNHLLPHTSQVMSIFNAPFQVNCITLLLTTGLDDPRAHFRRNQTLELKI